jgi:Ser/Thr protein kinase RdoA (MazF antagonist)
MGVPGIMLSELYDNQVLFLKSVEQCARQVAFLHQVPLDDCPSLSEDSLQQQLRKVDLLIKQFNVPCREAIATLIEKLMLLIRSVPSEEMTPLHGDLHLKNILVDNDTVYLIDLDNISLGNPLQDIGSFIAAILNLQIIGAIPKPLAEQAITVFLKAYNETIHFSVSTIDLRLYIATSLVVERIFRSFTRLKAGRMEIIEDLIQQAEMIMDTTFTPNWL